MTKKLYIIGLVKSRKNWKHWKKTFELFYCATIKMNCKVRGTSKNGSIRASKWKNHKLRKELIKELNEKNKIKELRRKTIKELKELIYRQNEKSK